MKPDDSRWFLPLFLGEFPRDSLSIRTHERILVGRLLGAHQHPSSDTEATWTPPVAMSWFLMFPLIFVVWKEMTRK